MMAGVEMSFLYLGYESNFLGHVTWIMNDARELGRKKRDR